MSWSRRSLVAALLALHLPVAQADTVIVDTVLDDNVNNDICSLREAIEYFNQDKHLIEDPEGATTTTARYQGCKRDGARSEVHTIKLGNHDAVHVVGSALTIRRSLTITGAESGGERRARIRVTGNERLFIIDSPPLEPDPLNPIPAPEPGAPNLVDASDTGTSNTDNFTTEKNPTIEGVADPNYVVRIYSRLLPSGGETLRQVTQAAADGTWQATLPTFANGRYQIYVRTAPTTLDPESPAAGGPRLTVEFYTEPGRRNVSLTDLDIEGCGSTCTSADGGLITTNEALALNNVSLAKASATARGGAVFVDEDGVLQLDNVVIRDMSAPDGGAIYAMRNTLGMSGSVITRSAATGAGGAVVKVASTTSLTGVSTTRIVNSVLARNTQGHVLSLRDGMQVNAVTAVENALGINFNSENVRVHNSILDATGAACDNLPAVPSMRFNLVTTTGGCPATDNQVIDTSVPAQQLLATPDSSGRCSAAFGLLCPSEYEAETGVQAIRLYVPRVLASYTDFDASPIINKGAPSTGSAETFCPNNDMRGNARTANACDIGSVEWQALATAARTGGVMKQSQANFTPDYAEYLDLLGDEELLPAAECPAAPYTAAIPGSYRPDLPGCPWLESTPTRGTVTFAANGAYQYTPAVRFHGFDDFKVRVITTASRLNAQPLTRSRVLDANVIVEPDSGIKSESLGGSVGVWYILYLAMAAIGLRGRRGR